MPEASAELLEGLARVFDRLTWRRVSREEMIKAGVKGVSLHAESRFYSGKGHGWVVTVGSYVGDQGARVFTGVCTNTAGFGEDGEAHVQLSSQLAEMLDQYAQWEVGP